MILREHLLQSDICPKHPVLKLPNGFIKKTVVLLYASVIVIRWKNLQPPICHMDTQSDYPWSNGKLDFSKAGFFLGFQMLILQAQGGPSRLKHDSQRLQWAASLS